jgi:hypothetical protein
LSVCAAISAFNKIVYNGGYDTNPNVNNSVIPGFLSTSSKISKYKFINRSFARPIFFT